MNIKPSQKFGTEAARSDIVMIAESIFVDWRFAAMMPKTMPMAKAKAMLAKARAKVFGSASETSTTTGFPV